MLVNYRCAPLLSPGFDNATVQARDNAPWSGQDEALCPQQCPPSRDGPRPHPGGPKQSLSDATLPAVRFYKSELLSFVLFFTSPRPSATKRGIVLMSLLKADVSRRRRGIRLAYSPPVSLKPNFLDVRANRDRHLLSELGDIFLFDQMEARRSDVLLETSTNSRGCPATE